MPRLGRAGELLSQGRGQLRNARGRAPSCWQVAKKGGQGAREKQLSIEGLDHAAAALALDEAHFAAHKWFAIMTSLASGFEGTKATIKASFVVKHHFERGELAWTSTHAPLATPPP